MVPGHVNLWGKGDALQQGGMVLIDNASNEILGAHLLGPETAEVVNLFGMAIRLGLKTRDLKRIVSAYPSVGSDFGSML